MSVIASSPQIVRMPRGGMRADFTHPILNGCVGWWPLTDGGGGIAKDITSNANDGTESGGVSWASTYIGAAASFDGFDDYFAIPHNSVYSIPTSGSLSVFLWVNPDNFSNYRPLIGKDDGVVTPNTGREWIIYGNKTTGALICQIFGATDYTTTGSNIATGVWSFVGMTWDGSTLKSYINGSLSSSNSYTITPNTTTNDVTIGANPFYKSPTDIQNVRIYNRALSATEVALLYTQPWSGLEALSPFAFYTTGAPAAGASRFLINGFRSLLINGGLVR